MGQAQYLSTDPHAGAPVPGVPDAGGYLSTDPSAGEHVGGSELPVFRSSTADKQDAAMGGLGLSPLALGSGHLDPRLEAIKGATKEFLKHVGGVADWARAHVPGVAKLDNLMTPIPVNLRPSNDAQRAGMFVENAAEYAVPVGAVSKRVSALSLPVRMAAEGAASAGVAGYQTGGDPNAMIPAGILGAAAPGVVGAVKGGVNAVRNAAAGAKEGGVGGAIANMVRPMVPMAPKQMLTIALKPRSANVRFGSDLDRAIPEVVQSADELGTPITGVESLMPAVKHAKQRVWSQFQEIMGPRAEAGLSLAPVADDMVASIPARTRMQSPASAAALEQKAAAYRNGTFTVGQTEQLLQETNAELEGFYNQFPHAQRAKLKSNPAVAHLEAEARGLRDRLYSFLDAAGDGAAARELKQRYGSLMNLEQEAARRANVAARQQPMSLAEQIAETNGVADRAAGVFRMGRGVVTGRLGDVIAGGADMIRGQVRREAGKFLKEQQTTDALIRRAFSITKIRPTPVNVTQRPVAGLLGPGARQAGPAPDASYVRSVPAMQQPPNPRRMLPEGRQAIPLGPASDAVDPSAVTSKRAAPLDYTMDPTVPVKPDGFRVAQFSGDPAAARAAVASPEVHGMLERMLDDLETFNPTHGRLIRSPGSAVKDVYAHGGAGSPIADDMRVVSEVNAGNHVYKAAIKHLLDGKLPSNRMHTAALDLAMGYLEKRPGYHPPTVPARGASSAVADDGFEAFSRSVDDLLE